MNQNLSVPIDANHQLENKIESIAIGSIVSNLAHPYTSNNANILITTYAHFTPPLMVVVEKNYGVSYNVANGEKEDKSSYKCLYYSTTSGSFELNWFKGRELKVIEAKVDDIVIPNDNGTLEPVKRELIGKMVILKNVDLELNKIKIWSDNSVEFSKMKTNNLLDFIPPLGSVIDVKFNDDSKKYNEKDGKIIHEKSRMLIKVRWLNNTNYKFSEEYLPLSALKVIDISLHEFSVLRLYSENSKIELEGNNDAHVHLVPLRFHDIIWKHYYYIYRFQNLFTNQITNLQNNSIGNIKRLLLESYEEGELIFDSSNLNYLNILSFFKAENKASFENRWLEIEYLDKGDKYSKRIIYIIELVVEDIPYELTKKRILVKSNCLLRSGKIRHFYVDRISSYRLLPTNFETIFIER